MRPMANTQAYTVGGPRVRIDRGKRMTGDTAGLDGAPGQATPSAGVTRLPGRSHAKRKQDGFRVAECGSVTLA